MQDIYARLAGLRRPSLLIKAARYGADRYRRETHLMRYIRAASMPKHGAAIMQLLDEEARLNALRIAGDAAYSIPRHVAVLIAVIGESRLMRNAATAQPAY